MIFRALREGVEVFASKARSGPTPLRSNRLGVGPTYLHKRGHSLLHCCLCDGSAEPGLRSLEDSDKGELSRYSRGEDLIAFNARYGPIPLRIGTCESTVEVLSGPEPQSRVDYRCPIWDEKDAQ
jgi:hypothetical protein